MSEKYTFHRAHKVEDWIANEMYDTVFEQVTQWFGVEQIADITEEQMDEIIDFRENDLNEYSPLQWGYSTIISEWEDEMWEKEQEG